MYKTREWKIAFRSVRSARYGRNAYREKLKCCPAKLRSNIKAKKRHTMRINGFNWIDLSNLSNLIITGSYLNYKDYFGTLYNLELQGLFYIYGRILKAFIANN